MRLWVIACLFFCFGCKAQKKLVSSNAENKEELRDMEFVNWYNKTMRGAVIVTNTKFELPEFSDIVAVVVTAKNPKATLEVSMRSGSRLFFIEPGHMYVDQVSYNSYGEVVGGLRDVVITGAEMQVVVKRCPTCVFKINYKTDL